MSDPTADLRLDGRVVIVTGGSQGIGGAIATRARALGAELVIAGRDAERGRAAAEALEGLFVEVELADPAAPARIVAAAEERHGRLDGIVSSAGLSTRGGIEDTTVELWDQLFAVNVRAPMLLLQAAIPLMRRGGGGSMVNVITMAAHGGDGPLMTYAASKAALVAITKNTGHALTKDRIRVNGLNIGWTLTEGEDALQQRDGAGPDWIERADAGAPLGRLLRPETDIAPMACLLLSDAGAMVTGSVMDWDQTVLGPSLTPAGAT
jgi:NAD(P)-dependent dehydrogenase (short-subunit alcohol dehydrogenase family)